MRKDGTPISVWRNVSTVTDDAGRVTHHVLSLSDVTALKNAQAQISRLAFVDELTGLANRHRFNERLDARSTTDLLEAYYLDIAASEFGSWWTDEQDWPPIRSLNDFFEYFECAPSETVVDLAADDDYADPADEDDD